jgi:hypothetical protein
VLFQVAAARRGPYAPDVRLPCHVYTIREIPESGLKFEAGAL